MGENTKGDIGRWALNYFIVLLKLIKILNPVHLEHGLLLKYKVWSNVNTIIY